MPETWIIDCVRTPRGRGKKETGALREIHPQELFAQTLNALVARNGFDPREVEDVVVGTVTEVAEQGGCVARMSVLAAGWPVEATAVSLNRFCGSGQQAVNFAAMGVMSGQQDLVIGGGVESMSRVPMGADQSGLDGHNRHLREIHPLVPQGVSADLIATLEGFSREDCDRFALESQRRAKTAMENGYFKKSLIPAKDLAGNVVLDRDEYPRPDATLEGLGKLEPSFLKMGAYRMKDGPLTFDEKAKQAYPQIGRVEHVHTAGNSSGIVDGAGSVLLASPDYARARGWKPRARIIATATCGAEPVIMLTAPVPATQRCLKKAKMTMKDIDLVEINEAFAAVPLKVMRDLDIPHDRVNVNGGAIALGHPLGATGAMLIGTVIDELERRDLTTGLVTMCIGGGMGITTILERF
ncbi:MAG: acetyl-CoA C-acetyltransferase [Deltaproteobacteria bacterium]|nr:acetyl-CoA C-acetyltransferase [Deltaproteobacteria bacterium]